VLLAAGIVVLGTLIFKVVEMVRGKKTVDAIVVTADGSSLAAWAHIKGELASIN
jgi:hypothetical protein